MPKKFDRELHVFKLPELKSVVDKAVVFFENTPATMLPPPRFLGCGIYALYYFGDCAYYSKLSKLNQESCTIPMYVGKAMPPGRRTGRTTGSETAKLYGRLREHMRSIERGSNIEVEGFRCRFMILEDVLSDLIVPTESELIRKYHPLWNSVIDGFGNHDPGQGRYDQAPSEWDVLHPGRRWVQKLTGTPPDKEYVTAKVKQYLDTLTLS